MRAGAAGDVTDMLGRRVRIPDHRGPDRVAGAQHHGDGLRARRRRPAGRGDRLLRLSAGGDAEASRRGHLHAELRGDPGAPARSGHRHLGEQLRGPRRAARRRSGCPVYVVRPVDWETVLESIERIGDVLGRDAVARAPGGRDAPGRGRHRARGGGRAAPARPLRGVAEPAHRAGPRHAHQRAHPAGRRRERHGRRAAPVSAPVAGDGRRAAPGPDHRRPPRAGDASRSSSAAGSGSARSARCARAACTASTATSSTGPGPGWSRRCARWPA